MRYLLSLILVLAPLQAQQILAPIFYQSPAAAAPGIALVSHTTGAAVSSLTTGAVNTTGATLLVVTVTCFSLDPSSGTPLSDSKGNTWIPLTAQTGGSGEANTVIWYAWNPTVGSGHTITMALTNGFFSVTFSSFSGIQTGVNPLGASQNGNIANSGTSIQPGSITPSSNSTLVFTALGAGGGGTGFLIDSGFTIIDSVPYSGGANEGNASAYLVQSVAAAVNPTWSWTGSTSGNASTIAYFK